MKTVLILLTAATFGYIYQICDAEELEFQPDAF